MNSKIILGTSKLGFPWETQNPFLFCVHHLDLYPEGNDQFGPNASLAGRNLGNDFVIKDGFRMYHGDKIPGFPVHPHRGFETITVVLQGLVDHSDSQGAAGRYGNGDVQWMTAGKGLQHCEMFPLLNKEGSNTLELFQIWLNLPASKKFVEPHFTMLWASTIPVIKFPDGLGGETEVTVIAGELDGKKAPPPAPDSWASDPENEVAIWRIRMDPGTSWKLPAASKEIHRNLFFFKGESITIEQDNIDDHCALNLDPVHPVNIVNGETESQLLLLQGKPINEPVVQYGPFVMNNQAEIHQAMTDYQNTRFGGWPWPRPDQVHDPAKGRFASYASGITDIPENDTK